MSTGRRILGLDPGVQATGWGLVQQEEGRCVYVASGTLTPKRGDSLAARLHQLDKALDEVVAEYQPDEAAVESPFAGVNIRAAFSLGLARAVCLLAPARVGLEVAEYAPRLVKKAVIGSGRAEKEQIRFMVGRLLPGANPDSFHAADALAIALTHYLRCPAPAALAS